MCWRWKDWTEKGKTRKKWFVNNEKRSTSGNVQTKQIVFLNCEILNKAIIIEFDDDQIHRENVTRHILSNNIKLYLYVIIVWKNMELGFKPGTKGWTWEDTRRMGRYKKYGKIKKDRNMQEGWENMRRLGRKNNNRKVQEQDNWGFKY